MCGSKTGRKFETFKLQIDHQKREQNMKKSFDYKLVEKMNYKHLYLDVKIESKQNPQNYVPFTILCNN